MLLDARLGSARAGVHRHGLQRTPGRTRGLGGSPIDRGEKVTGAAFCARCLSNGGLPMNTGPLARRLAGRAGCVRGAPAGASASRQAGGTLGLMTGVFGGRRLGLARPPLWLGLVCAALVVAVATAAIYPLKLVAPPAALSVMYLPAVLVISAYWGLALGLLTSLASAGALNFFHIPPVGRFTIADSRNWVALGAFILVAAVVSTIAEMARSRAVEAERRRGEADLAASLARELLRGANTRTALGATARSMSDALQIPAAAIELGAVQEKGRLALPLRGGEGEQIATLLVSGNLPAETVKRLRIQVVPALEALVAIALRRDAVQAEAVETEALRRSDDLKTALLRSVSHDLRTPVTAIVTAGHALAARSLTAEERRELSAAVIEEGGRLAALIDKLLDLSRLQAGRVESQPGLISIEEVLLAATEALPVRATNLRLSLDPDIPPVRADAVQLRQTFSNLLENAWRYSNGLPVSVLARSSGTRVIVRIVDQGPGIPRTEQERIFEPFYRGARAGERGMERVRPGAGDRQGVRRGQRRDHLGGLASRSGNELRGRVAHLPAQRGDRRVSVPKPGTNVRESRRPRVLVCDDETQILRALRVILRDAEFEALPASTGEEALDVAAVQRPDAAIVDLVLPDLDGVEVSRRLREWSEMPIIVLSAVGEEDAKVRALAAGADDYVTKPFGPRELIARLHAVLRRVSDAPEEAVIRADGLELDLAARVVRRDGSDVHLTPTEFDLLRVLARNRGRLITHRELLRKVWGAGYTEDTQVLRAHVANLRRKIEPADGPRYITTDPGVGYRFSA